MRGYRSADDLAAVGRLIRRAWALNPGWNAWTFARFDIWSHWRLADERLGGLTAWQDDVALWEDDGEIVAAAFGGESPGDGVIVSLPDRARLAAALLGWVEQRHPGARVELRASNHTLTELARSRGYRAEAGVHRVLWERVPDPRRGPAASLPAGVRIRDLDDAALVSYTAAVQAAFGRVGGTPAAYAIVRQGLSAVRELGLVAIDEAGTVVGFTEAWLDAGNAVAELEPVGTIPNRRREGIASALIAEIELRLSSLGCRRVLVLTGSARGAANALYEGLGYGAVDRVDSWRAPTR
jgi:ribosomal protein S18 acetylase RimI-like enzyme